MSKKILIKNKNLVPIPNDQIKKVLKEAFEKVNSQLPLMTLFKEKVPIYDKDSVHELTFTGLMSGYLNNEKLENNNHLYYIKSFIEIQINKNQLKNMITNEENSIELENWLAQKNLKFSERSFRCDIFNLLYDDINHEICTFLLPIEAKKLSEINKNNLYIDILKLIFYMYGINFVQYSSFLILNNKSQINNNINYQSFSLSNIINKLNRNSLKTNSNSSIFEELFENLNIEKIETENTIITLENDTNEFLKLINNNYEPKINELYLNRIELIYDIRNNLNAWYSLYNDFIQSWDNIKNFENKEITNLILENFVLFKLFKNYYNQDYKQNIINLKINLDDYYKGNKNINNIKISDSDNYNYKNLFIDLLNQITSTGNFNNIYINSKKTLNWNALIFLIATILKKINKIDDPNTFINKFNIDSSNNNNQFEFAVNKFKENLDIFLSNKEISTDDKIKNTLEGIITYIYNWLCTIVDNNSIKEEILNLFESIDIFINLEKSLFKTRSDFTKNLLSLKILCYSSFYLENEYEIKNKISFNNEILNNNINFLEHNKFENQWIFKFKNTKGCDFDYNFGLLNNDHWLKIKNIYESIFEDQNVNFLDVIDITKIDDFAKDIELVISINENLYYLNSFISDLNPNNNNSFYYQINTKINEINKNYFIANKKDIFIQNFENLIKKK